MSVLFWLLLLVVTGAIPLPVALFMFIFFGLLGVGSIFALTPPTMS